MGLFTKKTQEIKEPPKYTPNSDVLPSFQLRQAIGIEQVLLDFKKEQIAVLDRLNERYNLLVQNQLELTESINKLNKIIQSEINK